MAWYSDIDKQARAQAPQKPAKQHKTGGGWITIGGREEGDKKHVGGFPVKIDAEGRIILGGPKGLKGKKVSDVGKFFRRSRGQKKAAKQSRDIFKRQASVWGVTEAEYRDLADEVYQAQADHFKAREQAKAEARRRLGITAADIRRWENEGFDVGGKHGKQFDTLGREFASLYSDLGWGSGYGDEYNTDVDYGEKLWDMLQEGKRTLPAKNSEEFHCAVNDYLNTIGAERGATADDVEPKAEDWEAVPFALRMSEEGPKEGDFKIENGVTYVFHNSRWHRSDKQSASYKQQRLGDRKLKGTHSSVHELVDDSLQGSGNSKFRDFSHVSEEEASLVRQAFDLDVSRYVHSMSEADIRHVLNTHGHTARLSADEEPVYPDDIKRVPEIIAAPDSVKPTRDDDHVGLQYNKRENGTIVVVEVVAKDKEKLRLKTMRKHRAKS